MACPSEHDYCVRQGNYLDVSLIWKEDDVPKDITGYSGRFALVWLDEEGAQQEWTTDSDDLVNPVVLGGVAGTVTVRVPTSITKQIPVGTNVAQYELAVDEDGDDDERKTLLMGNVTILTSPIEIADANP